MPREIKEGEIMNWVKSHWKLLAIALAVVVAAVVLIVVLAGGKGGDKGNHTESPTPVNDSTVNTTPENNPAEENQASVPDGSNTDDFDFYVTETGTVVTSYHGESSTIVIPSSYEGNPVNIIGDCFRDSIGSAYSDVTVVIPDSFTVIGEKVFQDCTAIVAVLLPDTIKEIGDFAFWGCTNLQSVNIPGSIEHIGWSAFEDCSSLTGTLEFPLSLHDIGPSAFRNCAGIQGAVFKDCPAVIEEAAFEDCTNLASVSLGNAITRIDSAAFSNTQITTICIPGSITGSGYCSAINECDYLETIEVLEGVENFDLYAFSNAPAALKTITLPSGIPYVGRYSVYESWTHNLPFAIRVPAGSDTEEAFKTRGVNYETY